MSRLDQLQKLLATEPDDAFLNFGLAMELAKAERFEESLVQFERVMKLDPNYIAAYFQKAKTLLAMGDDDAAKAELRRGITQAQSCGELHAKGEMEELLGTL